MKRTKPPAAPVPAPAARKPVPTWLWGAALIVLVAIVYRPTLSNGFIWDDDQYIEDNPTLHSVEGLRDVWFKPGAVPQYYPLVYTTFWIETQLWGKLPVGFHVVNMVLHAVSVLLAWRLLVRLQVPGAWLAAALFAVHPVAVESVAWVTERKNVLSMALALGSLLAYLQFSPAEPAAGQDTVPERGSRWLYVLALVLYVAALLSKTVTASVPAVLLVIYWWKQGRIPRREVAWLTPFFAIGLAMAYVTVWVERVFVGAQGAEWDFTPVERVLIAGRALWFYAGKLLWPEALAFFYPRWTIDSSVWWQYLYPLAALAVMIGLWLARGRIGRGPLAAVLIFAGVLVPALGFFNVFPFLYSFVADHFQYHAMLALLALAAAALTLLAHRAGPSAMLLVPVGAVALLAPLAVLAHRQTEIYRDLGTLYNATIEANPLAWPAHVNLAYALQQAGQFDGAVEHYREALRINPGFPSTRVRLGTALFLAGHADEATGQFQKALADKLNDHERAMALLHYGIVLNFQGRFDDAIAQYQAALALRPQLASALLNYGIALEGKGDTAAAIAKLRESLAANPHSPLAHNTLGNILLAHGDAQGALVPLQEAVRLQETSARFRDDLASALIATDDLPAAQRELRIAVELNPLSAEAHVRLAQLCKQLGDTAEAVTQLRAALQLDPKHATATAELQGMLRPENREGAAPANESPSPEAKPTGDNGNQPKSQ